MKRFTPFISFLIFLFFFISSQDTLLAQTEWTYISPMPGSKYINPENNIAFRHGDVLDISSIRSADIRVIGSIRGTIPGSFTLSNDHRTLIFYPDQPFALKEQISVKLNKGIKTVSGQEMEGVEFSFQIKEIDNYPLLIELYQKRYEQEQDLWEETIEGKSKLNNYNPSRSGDLPENYPVPLVTEYDDPTPGYTFVSPNGFRGAPYGKYNVILDNYGTPVYYRDWHSSSRDFKLVSNNRLLSSEHSRQNPSINKYLVFNSHFEIIDTLMMGNGYNVDAHDALLLENDHYFLMAYDPQLIDMSQIVPGGDTNATVIGFIIQELDPDGNVIFQWRSWDHFEITDAAHEDMTSDDIDYVHGNAFELDIDSNLMFSSRHLDEIAKIDLVSGDVIWRFGPKATQNMFTFTNDTMGFSHQHDIRRIANGNITLYDNGNYHSPKVSYSKEYQIDENTMTATLVWNYANDPEVYGGATGSSQRLDNNNTLICWGATWPVTLTETTYDHEKLWEVDWPYHARHYRGIKYDWRTDLFETNLDTIDYGEYDDYVAWPRIFIIQNNADYDIQITSTHNHWDSYSVVTALPLDIPAGGSAQMTVNFYPTMEGQINDVLTLNYDTYALDTLPVRISRQVFLKGFVADELAPEVTLNPADGTVNFPQDTTISIYFDEPVVKIGGETLKVEDLADILVFQTDDDSAMAVEYHAVINAWKTKITIVPDTLYPDQNYYLEVKANMLSDNEENAISEPAISHFTTGEEFGITENILEFVNIFPNPTNDILNIEIKDKFAEFIRVMDISGRVFYEVETPPDQQISVDLTGLPAGIYIVELKLQGFAEAFTVKVVKK